MNESIRIEQFERFGQWRAFLLHNRLTKVIFAFPWLLLLAMAYLAQNITMPLESADQAQQADYLTLILEGAFPYRDFLDIYGPLNWFPPAAGYALSGQRWLGVRIWVWCLQVLSVFFVYFILSRTSNKFYAALGMFWATVYLGQRWDFHYTPYAFMQIYPLAMAALLLQLRFTKSTRLWPQLLIGALLAAMIFIKINAGLFYVCAFLLNTWIVLTPVYSSGVNQSYLKVLQKIPAWLWLCGKIFLLSIFFSIFTLYLKPHYEKQYFLHLHGPLIILYLSLIFREIKAFRHNTQQDYCQLNIHQTRQSWQLFMGIVLGCFGFFCLFAMFGMAIPMLKQLPTLIAATDYSTGFRILGNSDLHNPSQQMLTTYFWPQLPWLLGFLAAFVLFMNLCPISKSAFFVPPRQRQNITITIALLCVAVHGHLVIYPTPDLGHLMQDYLFWIVLAIHLISVLIQQLSTGLKQQNWAAFGLGLMILLLCFPFLHWQGNLLFSKELFKETDGVANRAIGLEKYTNSFTQGQPEVYHQDLIEVSRYLLKHRQTEESLWVWSEDTLIYFYANAPFFGGQYRFVYYMANHGRVDQENFKHLVGATEMARINSAPPPYLVLNRRKPNPHLASLFRDWQSAQLAQYRVVKSTPTFDVLKHLE